MAHISVPAEDFLTELLYLVRKEVQENYRGINIPEYAVREMMDELAEFVFKKFIEERYK